MKKLLLTLISTIIILGCKDDDNPPPPAEVSAPAVSGIQVIDVTRVADGIGMQITFNRVGDESLISEYRVFVVKSSAQAAFDLAKAESVSTGNYTKLEADGTNKVITLDESSIDSDGTALVESTPYVVFVLSIADGVNAVNNSLSSSSSVITLEQPVVLAVTNIQVLDIANAANASDMEVAFSLFSTENISELRLFLVKEANTSAYDLAQAESVAVANYQIVDKSTRKLRLNDGDKDVDGDLVGEANSYNVFVMSVADEASGLDNVLSSASSAVTLVQANAVSTLTADIPGGSGGMDVDAAGNIYMADFGTALNGGSAGTQVFKVTPTGDFSVFATGLVGASGNDFDPDGNLIQSNIGAGSVSKITPAGVVTSIASGFSSPVGVTVDDNGDFYVCNCGANSISKVTNDGATVTTFATSTLMSCPNGIDMDDDGNLYVASFSTSNLVKITPAGEVSVLATMPGNNNGHLLINGDFIYVVSRGLHQIQRVTFAGEVSLFAGSGTRGIINGPALQAGFSFPNDLAFSPDGKKMYINDVNAGNDGNILTPVVIRVIDLAE